MLFTDRQHLHQLDVVYDAATNTAELVVRQSPTVVKRDRRDAEGKPALQDITLNPAIAADGLGHTGIKITPTPAIQAGLRPGDVVLAMNGHTFGQSVRELQFFQATIRDNPDQAIPVVIQRADQSLTLTVTPKTNATGEGAIGVGLLPNGTFTRQPVRGLAVFSVAAEEFQNIVVDTLDGFGKLISRFSQVADQVAGPVAIVAVGAKIAQSDAASLFQFAALISINLAIINILPLPALDGGHLAFLLIEGVRGKPLPSKIQDGVMQTGLMLLLGLGIFLIIRDTANLIPQ